MKSISVYYSPHTRPLPSNNAVPLPSNGVHQRQSVVVRYRAEKSVSVLRRGKNTAVPFRPAAEGGGGTIVD